MNGTGTKKESSFYPLQTCHALMTKTAEQLLTEEEIRKLLDSCTNRRDRTFLAMMYEGGFRIGERLHLCNGIN